MYEDSSKHEDTSNAINIVEGTQESTLEERIWAWKYLISTGLCWKFQGWFGRMAMDIIEMGVKELDKDEIH